MGGIIAEDVCFFNKVIYHHVQIHSSTVLDLSCCFRTCADYLMSYVWKFVYMLILIKDTMIIKSPMKPPSPLRILVLVFAMLFGVYICSVCMKQTNVEMNTEFLNVDVRRKQCEHSVDRSQTPFLHYPKPTTFSRAECECNPVRLFAIVSMQRSGSGWFETLLNSHMNVSSNGEIFFAKERRNNFSSVMWTLDRVYNLDWFTSASKKQCSAAVGFKWMLNQGLMEYHKEITEYFNNRGVSVIFLFRRNLLRRMVSVLANSYDRQAKLLNGTHKSHVHSPEEAETLARYKPVINSKTLLMDLKIMDKTASEALQYFSSTRHIILYYEDLLKNRTKLVDVQNFLGLPLMMLTSRQVKIHKGPLLDHIKNWDDVNNTLRGTTYGSFLLPDYTS